MGYEGSFLKAAADKGAPSGTRGVASGDPDSIGLYANQHEFFLHTGEKGDGTFASEPGRWLQAGWHFFESGGFDGRWVRLFPAAAEAAP